MLQNYLKIALRQLGRHKGYTFINILGLAIGMACCLLILMYVQDELSYDKFHKDGDRIYRMALERKYPGRARLYAIIPHSYAHSAKEEYPEVEDATRMFFFQGTVTFKKDEALYEEANRIWADSNFFQFFDFKLLEGKPDEVLNKPESIVLTQSTARKYFGEENAVGKTMRIPAPQPGAQDVILSVTGVCEDLPENSHMRFDMIQSSTALQFIQQQTNYISFSAFSYLKLAPNASAEALESKFPDMVTKFASGPILRNFGVTYEEYQKSGNGYRYFLQPLPEIYLTSQLESEMKPNGSKARVYIFLAIAILILFIACINFMNLATARSAERAKEVGIRKTLGSDRQTIAGQFLIEAIAISLISTILAWAILQLSIPWFNQIANKSFSTAQITNLQYIPGLIGMGLLVGLLAGSYPAFFLSNFKPLEVLRGKFASTGKGTILRNSLVVFQFAISAFLIIATIVVYRQLEYIQNKELGFNKEHLVTLTGAFGLTPQKSDTFKKKIKALPGVVAVSGCNTQPGDNYFGISFRPQGANEMSTGSGMVVDEGYVECMNMEIIEGRSFSEEFTDTLSVIINEAAVKEMGLTDPIGKQLESNNAFLNANPDSPSQYTIVGVIKDFHFQTLHQVISPLFMVHNESGNGNGVDNLITVRMSPPDFQGTINAIEALWKTELPNQPFNYDFMDRDWELLYQKEMDSRRVLSVFAFIAIFIACMGLLGLAAYITQQRTKEIGIRKVLGATTENIVTLLSKDFLKLVAIALVFASPLAWWLGKQWLQDFAYRIEIQWWMFVVAGLLAVAIAFFTVSFQSIRAALANPINSLRDE